MSKTDELYGAVIKVLGGIRPVPPRRPTTIALEAQGCFTKRINQHCALLGESPFEGCCLECPIQEKIR